MQANRNQAPRIAWEGGAVTEHCLKILKQFMPRIRSGQKTFEIRKNDRDYQVGDILRLYEYDPSSSVQWAYEGRNPSIIAKVVYMTTAYQQEGYCVLGIEVQKPTTKGVK